MTEQLTSENFEPAGKTPVSARPAVICLLLVAVTAVFYWPVTRCDFVNYDDPDYFFSNPHVLAGLSPANLVWAFTTRCSGNWHPLTWLSLMLDVNLFGRGAAGSHVTNLLFHLANTMLVFLLLRSLTRATWRSAAVAALFALHPLHVESVAWISERKDVLSAFFGLLSLSAYACYAQGTGNREPEGITSHIPHPTSNAEWCYWSAVFFFVLGLTSKPMLVTLPFVMLLLDYWPLQRAARLHCASARQASGKWQVAGLRSLMVEKIPFFTLSTISCVVTFIVQQKSGAMVSLMKISLAGRFENIFVSYGRYLGKTFWPVNLAVLYPHPIYWDAGLVIFSLMLVIGLTVAAVWLGRRFPFVFTGWFWFIGTLIPVIGLVQVGNQSLADRYSYLPLVGLFVILAWGGWELWSRWRLPQSFLVLAVLLLLAAAAWQTRIQVGYWQNSETLFRHTLAVTQNNSIAWNNLGICLSSQGQVTEAMDCYTKSLQINPDNSDALYNMGNAFAKSGNLDEAMDHYRHALKIAPARADVLNNLGIVLASQKQFADATACFEKALKLNPDYADAHNNFATVLFIQKRFDEAVRHFREALRRTPDSPQIYSNLGDALMKQGQTAEAVRCYQEALRLKPDDPKIKARLQALGASVSN